jgi:hypothetical protein
MCTQQSKIYSIETRQKHLSYLLSERIYYFKIYEKSSFLTSSTKEGSCLRITFFYKRGVAQKYALNKKKSSKLRSNIIGQTSIATTNNQAMYLDLTINSRKIIILNTELLAPDSINFGESKRELEFLSLIKEFELHKKYNEGYNIIICGSLNFRLKNMYKIINNSFRLDLYNTFQNSIQQNSINQKIQKNQLKIYLNQLIKELQDNKGALTASVSKNEFTKLFEINTMYLNLFLKFSNSIKTVGFHQNCGFSNGNNTRKDYASNIVKNAMSKSGSSVLGIFSGLIKGTFTAAVEKTFASSEKIITKMKKEFKLPAMCDKIIFALQDNNEKKISYIDKSFEVLSEPIKSNRRIICIEFNM